MTVQEFIRKYAIEMTYTSADSNPNMESDSRNPMNHWRVKLTAVIDGRKSSMTLAYSTGMAISAPELESVLDCLASDSASYDNARDFADWCSEYGYDTDSRRAEKTYKAVGKERENVARFLSDAYVDLLNVEF